LQHFTDEDFLPTERCRLVPTAVPSVLPWTTESFKRHSETSQIVASEKQRCDLIDKKVSSENTECSNSDSDGINEDEGSCQEEYNYLDDAIEMSATEIDDLLTQIIDLCAKVLQLQQTIVESKSLHRNHCSVYRITKMMMTWQSFTQAFLT